MPTTPNGVPYPGNPASEPPNGPLQFQQMAQAIDTKLVGRFSTITGLRQAYPNAVRGQTAMVGHLQWVFTGTEWVLPGASMWGSRNEPGGLPNTDWVPFVSNTNWQGDDPYGMRAGGSTFTAPWPGYYTISAGITFESNSSGMRGLRVNPIGANLGRGVGLPAYIGMGAASPGSNTTIFSGTVPTALFAAGQTAQVEARQTSPASITVETVWISATFVRPA